MDQTTQTVPTLVEPSMSERLDEALRRLRELAGALPEGRLREAVDDVAYGLACSVWVGAGRWPAVEVLTTSMPWDQG